MAKFPKDLQEVTAFASLLGAARFKRYLAACAGDEAAALQLYMWNARVAQAFYLPLHLWEICLRNRVNNFLCWRYGAGWPYNPKATRQIKKSDADRLAGAIRKQERRYAAPVSTDAIVADLSAGFWVRMLGKGYQIPMKWQFNLPKVFPASTNACWRIKPAGFDMAIPHALCEDVLNLRNRVAHHEPLAWMNLKGLHYKIGALVHAMCPASFSYLESHCTVQNVLAQQPPGGKTAPAKRGPSDTPA